jgi:hypothetical protein
MFAIDNNIHIGIFNDPAHFDASPFYEHQDDQDSITLGKGDGCSGRPVFQLD